MEVNWPPSKPSSYNYLPPKNDITNSETNTNPPNNPLLANISGLDNRIGICRPVYQQHQPEAFTENPDSPHHSPTYSQLVDPEVFTLGKEFQPNEKFLNKEFNS